jgi:hypothetical protein
MLIDLFNFNLFRFKLASKIREFADSKQLFEPYEYVLTEYLELMRLDQIDKFGIRNLAPFAFLNLGRDDDCYNFIKDFARIDRNKDSKIPDSKEGDWIYLTGQDKMEYLDHNVGSLEFLVSSF